MSNLTGTVLNGVVVFDGGQSLPEGTKVRVAAESTPKASIDLPTSEEPTHTWMLKFAGKLNDMPADFAAQHDHYIHGTPKR